jgi:hypothetical protein
LAPCHPHLLALRLVALPQALAQPCRRGLVLGQRQSVRLVKRVQHRQFLSSARKQISGVHHDHEADPAYWEARPAVAAASHLHGSTSLQVHLTRPHQIHRRTQSAYDCECLWSLPRCSPQRPADRQRSRQLRGAACGVQDAREGRCEENALLREQNLISCAPLLLPSPRALHEQHFHAFCLSFLVT